VDPENPDPFLVRGRLHDRSREFEKALADFSQVLRLHPRAAEAYQERGSVRFKLGQIEQSLADFDQFLRLAPSRKPYHWQRGISCYYAGRFEEGRKQFESHQTVNSQDVENAVWHFLCVARLSGVEHARASLIPISADSRVPLMQIHALFAGKAKPDDVLATARAGNPTPGQLNERLFYAHLYLGLYYEATGDAEKIREHIFKAAEEFPVEHYMGDVARVHAGLLQKKRP
jgi:lipoprotein NlpI